MIYKLNTILQRAIKTGEKKTNSSLLTNFIFRMEMFCTAEDSWRMCDDDWRSGHLLYQCCEMKVIVVDLLQQQPFSSSTGGTIIWRWAKGEIRGWLVGCGQQGEFAEIKIFIEVKRDGQRIDQLQLTWHSGSPDDNFTLSPVSLLATDRWVPKS